jgi:myo-inositol 2-dehydrogenase/D-chiro-inositol 1-dehydrogenase
MTELSIGLLGAGRIGKVHGQAIATTAGTRLGAVADAIDEAAAAIGSAYGAEVRSIEEILGADDIDAVLIATPTDTHADLIEAAVRAGKAVFCEKPIDLSVARVRQCLEVVAEHEGTLMVGFNRRFDPNFRSLRNEIDAGAVGDVEMVTITSRDPAPPPVSYMERSGGLFKDMTIHDFDMARFLLGDEPVAVSAMGSVLVDEEIREVPDIDSAAVTLVTGSGRIAQISNSRRASYGYDQRVEVHGSTGMIRADNLHRSTVETASDRGYTRPPLLDFFLERYMEAYRAEIAAFVDSVRTGSRPEPGGDAGLASLVLAEAAGRSLDEGRVVAVDEI